MTDAAATVAPYARPVVAPRRLRGGWIAAGVGAVLVATVLGLCLGPVGLPLKAVFGELLDHLPFVSVHSGLNEREAAIIWEVRFPRVVLGLLVGAMLSVAGGSYQGVFRNALADPYLLGAAAGAGLGATLVIVNGGTGSVVTIAAFAGALGAVALAYVVGAAGDRLRSSASLLLAGVAVASFLTALQTYALQRNNNDTIRQVYSWILGRLNTVGWGDVGSIVPYFVVTSAVLLACRRSLDVLTVGDEEAASLGLHPQRTRLIVVAAASLATAAAVSVSGLIGFVGIIVPHTVRLVAGQSYRVVLPLSILFGAAFLALTDLVARTAISPAELPIGVVTAFFGAPFFIVVLRRTRGAVA